MDRKSQKGQIFDLLWQVIPRGHLTPMEDRVMNYLIRRSNDDLDCWPYTETVAEDCCICDRQEAGVILRGLRDKGCIKIYKRKKVSGNRNGYIINIEGLKALSEKDSDTLSTKKKPKKTRKKQEKVMGGSQETSPKKTKEPPPRKPDKPKSQNLIINESHETEIPHRAAIELKVVENNLSPAEILANMKKLTNSMRRNL